MIASVTAGPARAISSSCLGSSGMRSSRATPPIGSRITSGVRTPKRRAIRMWPNSWSRMQKKKQTKNSVSLTAAAAPAS